MSFWRGQGRGHLSFKVMMNLSAFFLILFLLFCGTGARLGVSDVCGLLVCGGRDLAEALHLVYQENRITIQIRLHHE